MSPVKKTISNRFAVIFGIIVILFMATVVKLVSIRYVEGEELRNKVDALNPNKKSNIKISANRGGIYAANGELLSTTFEYRNIFIDFGAECIRHTKERDSLFNLHLPQLAKWLSHTFGDKTAKEYEKSITAAYRSGNKARNYKLCPQRISYRQYEELLGLPFFTTKIKIQGKDKEKKTIFRRAMTDTKEYERFYIFGEFAKQTIGNNIIKGEKERRYGIEKEWNDSLTGKTGLGESVLIGDMRIERCYKGKETIDGYDIHTTLDIGTQNIADEALRKKLSELGAATGCLLLMHSRTGELRAIVNLQQDSNGKYSEQINMAFGDILPNENIPQPGSTFKVPVMMALLESGKIDLNTEVDVEDGIINLAGTEIKDDKDHQFPDRKSHFAKPEEIIVTSLNTGISKLLWNAYGKTPEQRKEFYDLLYKMNLDTKIDFRTSIYNISEGSRHSISPSTNAVDFVKMSYGYGKVRIPPINMLMFYNAIANDGKMIKPFFVKSLNRDGKEIHRFEAEVINPKICSPKTLGQIQTMLEKVVDDEHGTAYRRAKSDVVKIAGKTGTAQIHNKDMQITGYQASFVGYFPIDGEMYSCIVVMRGKSLLYGSASASVVKEVAEKMFLNNTRFGIDQMSIDGNEMKVPSKSGNYAELKNAARKLGIEISGNTDAEWVKTNAEDNQVKVAGIAQVNVNSVKDMGLKDAVYLLEKAGYTVRLNTDNCIGTVQEIKQNGKYVELTLK